MIVDRHTAYESPVAFTPYIDEHRIDGAALGVIMDTAYAEAGVSPGDIDTGVVILTGERSVLHYITAPLTDAISKSLREE